MLKWFVIGMYALKIAFNAYVDHLREVAAKRELPDCVKDVYDETEYNRWQAYHSDKRKLDTVKSVVLAVINIALLVGNIYSTVFKLLPGGTFVHYVLFALIFEGLNIIVYMPFEYYATFTIEEKYGMNKATKGTFFGDQIKKFVLGFCLMGFLMFLVMGAFENFGNKGILIACAGVAAFLILMQLTSGIFLRLFNKFTPLEDGSLKEKLLALCTKYGARVKRIDSMDMSRRTTKANAFCSGIGKNKRVALADNLIERYTEDQIVAVFAHEFGHAKHKDVPKLMLGNIIRVCVTICLYAVILNFPSLFTSFGFDGVNYYFLFMLELITWPISTLADLVINWFGRRCEYRADAMAAKEGYGEDIISALKQLNREALKDLNPHPVVVALEYNHPTLAQRIEAVKSSQKETSPVAKENVNAG